MPKQFSLARRSLLLAPMLGALSGCNMVVMSPSGDIAAQQRDLIVVSTILMLVISLGLALVYAAFLPKDEKA